MPGKMPTMPRVRRSNVRRPPHERVQRRFSFALRIVNIETDPELERAYGEQIPVVFINGNKSFKYRVDEAELEKKVKRLWKT